MEERIRELELLLGRKTRKVKILKGRRVGGRSAARKSPRDTDKTRSNGALSVAIRALLVRTHHRRLFEDNGEWTWLAQAQPLERSR